MSGYATHRRNKMYSHESSKAMREAVRNPPVLGPVGELSRKHNTEKNTLARQSDDESNQLHWKQQKERDKDPVAAMIGRPHDLTLLREKKERDALFAEHDQARKRLGVRQRAEMEAAIKKHGSAL